MLGSCADRETANKHDSAIERSRCITKLDLDF